MCLKFFLQFFMFIHLLYHQLIMNFQLPRFILFLLPIFIFLIILSLFSKIHHTNHLILFNLHHSFPNNILLLLMFLRYYDVLLLLFQQYNHLHMDLSLLLLQELQQRFLFRYRAIHDYFIQTRKHNFYYLYKMNDIFHKIHLLHFLPLFFPRQE